MPPGTGQVVHYRFKVPEDAKGEIDVAVKLQYRKFDAKYMKYIYPDKEENDLPIVVMSSDTVTFPVDGEAALGQAPVRPAGAGRLDRSATKTSGRTPRH